MKAMILAAGFGTRLRPLTTVCPKPMFPVLNRPLLEHTLHRLSAQNIREIVINLHHLPEQILDHFGDGSRFGVRLKFSCEGQILGTAGGIKAARKYLNGEPFFVINSDVVAEIDLPRVMEFHRRRRSRLTLVVREDASPEKFDPIEMDGAGRIVHFVGASSKTLPADTTRVMFTGIQVMEPDIFDRIPDGRLVGTTEDVFPEMIEEGLPIYGFLHQGYWLDMGTRESYLRLNADALDGRIGLRGSPSYAPEGPLIVPPVLIGKNCRLAREVQVGPYGVLGNGCQVKHGAVVEHSVCWEGVVLGSGTTVRDSVLADGTIVPDGEKVIDRSLIPPRP